MAVQRISEKEFRTRRRDRRMVWVDAAAFLVGLVIVTASVGGVIWYEEEQDPIEWVPVFIETRVHDERTCAGYEGGSSQGEACSVPRQVEKQEAGTVLDYTLSVSQANVTQVDFTLRWLDEIPETDPAKCEQDQPEYCNREWDYNQDSTAILNITVIAPWGEEFSAQGANDWENVTSGTGNGVPSGRVDLQIPVMQPPEDVAVYPSFSREDALREFNRTYYDDEHRGIGDWTALVTVVRQSSMNGTFPTMPCQDAGLSEEEAPEECDLYEEYELVFGPGQGGGEGGLPSAYTGFYGVYGQPLMDPVKGQIPEDYKWTSSYRSEGQSWTLSMTVRGYEAMADVAEDEAE